MKKAHKLLLNTDQFKEWVKYNNLLGGIFLTNNKPIKATFHFEEAFRNAKLGKLHSSQILSMNNLAELKMNLSLFKEAIKILQKALLLGKKENDLDKQLFSYNLIALCFYQIRNYAIAMDYIQKTLILLQKHENYLIRIQVFNTKGGIHLKNKELQLANEAFKSCLIYAKKLKATDFKINSMCNIGETYFEMEQYDLAEAGELTDTYLTVFDSNLNDIDSDDDSGANFLSKVIVPLYNLTNKTVGINEIVNNKEFKLYPNPTNNFINIRSRDNIDSYEIYNLNGQLLKSDFGIYTTECKINVSEFAQGLYFMVATVDGERITNKFTKR